ncbi:SIR2-domain-containing protein [Infundibulicybe gibba]|nr:SIR2-domain-containing protein [Infundibulicybe gibba]
MSKDGHIKISQLAKENVAPATTVPEGGSTKPPDINSKGLLFRQLRAFLSAAEDVDIDTETMEDLMQMLPEECDLDATDESHSASGSESGSVSNDEALETLDDQIAEEEVWTRGELKQMMHHLKERGMTSWIQEYVLTRQIAVPKLLQAFGVDLCPELQTRRPSTLLYFLRVMMSRELQMRDKLLQYNTIDDAVNLIRSSSRIIILTGAGISVSCGIPDFRSRDGLYASLKNGGRFDLDDPQQMFDIYYFKENPSDFFSSFASQIYPSNFVPSPCHRFIKLIEDKGKLLRNYTQNIDTLETQAGVQRVLQCHGSFATASCTNCHRKVPGSDIEDDIMHQKVPLCTICSLPPKTPPALKRPKSRKKAKGEWDSDVEDESDGPEYPPGIMKPDITFFGEKLDNIFDRSLAEDRERVDLLLVIGTSLKVSPVAEILSHLPHSIPQILINKTPIRHINPDIILLGDADTIVTYLCSKLVWNLPASTVLPLPEGNTRKRPISDINDALSPQRIGESHIWLFEGAEGGKWVESLQIGRDMKDRAQSTSLGTPEADKDAKKPRLL